jgi:hypothetical protein
MRSGYDFSRLDVPGLGGRVGRPVIGGDGKGVVGVLVGFGVTGARVLGATVGILVPGGPENAESRTLKPKLPRIPGDRPKTKTRKTWPGVVCQVTELAKALAQLGSPFLPAKHEALPQTPAKI